MEIDICTTQIEYNAVTQKKHNINNNKKRAKAVPTLDEAKHANKAKTNTRTDNYKHTDIEEIYNKTEQNNCAFTNTYTIYNCTRNTSLNLTVLVCSFHTH